MLCTCSSSSYRHSLLSNGTSWRRKSLWQFPHALTLHTNSSILSMAWWACRRGDIPINPSSSWGDSSLWLLSSELWVGEKKKKFCKKVNRERSCCFPYKTVIIWGVGKQAIFYPCTVLRKEFKTTSQKIITFSDIWEQLTCLIHFAHAFTRFGSAPGSAPL